MNDHLVNTLPRMQKNLLAVAIKDLCKSLITAMLAHVDLKVAAYEPMGYHLYRNTSQKIN